MCWEFHVWGRINCRCVPPINSGHSLERECAASRTAIRISFHVSASSSLSKALAQSSATEVYPYVQEIRIQSSPTRSHVGRFAAHFLLQPWRHVERLADLYLRYHSPSHDKNNASINSPNARNNFKCNTTLIKGDVFK
jgi:hypothetical protein